MQSRDGIAFRAPDWLVTEEWHCMSAVREGGLCSGESGASRPEMGMGDQAENHGAVGLQGVLGCPPGSCRVFWGCYGECSVSCAWL